MCAGAEERYDVQDDESAPPPPPERTGNAEVAVELQLLDGVGGRSGSDTGHEGEEGVEGRLPIAGKERVFDSMRGCCCARREVVEAVGEVYGEKR